MCIPWKFGPIEFSIGHERYSSIQKHTQINDIPNKCINTHISEQILILRYDHHPSPTVSL